ncbi:phage protein NinX family protein [Cupriavidus nantongensis]|uniref:DUF2591 domain-containing protein n=1 Tax=Cupriavidus nantongensis TaxID=1796606 RepID=A0A142JHV0_9BURK|nr:phage protein NinX family protein [Cupriavidus nantongensis]AMR77662.1 hypothetical protein A2G96_07900 [Cupriavidus nantongensis]
MKVSELQEGLLDYWVAKALGDREISMRDGKCESRFHPDFDFHLFSPTVAWHEAGPIIQANNIQIGPPTGAVHRYGGPNAGWGPSGFWSACTWHAGVDGKRAFGHDKDSPLVAAMRCYVMLKFGREVPEVTQ